MKARQCPKCAACIDKLVFGLQPVYKKKPFSLKKASLKAGLLLGLFTSVELLCLWPSSRLTQKLRHYKGVFFCLNMLLSISRVLPNRDKEGHLCHQQKVDDLFVHSHNCRHCGYNWLRKWWYETEVTTTTNGALTVENPERVSHLQDVIPEADFTHLYVGELRLV